MPTALCRQPRPRRRPDRCRPAVHLRRAEQHGQLQPLRVQGESTGSRRRRGPTTTWRWSTWPSPSTRRRARFSEGHSTPARSGRAFRSRIAPIRAATRSSPTTRSRTAGILTQFTTRLPTSPPNPFYNCVAVSVTATRLVRTTATRSPPATSSPITRSTALWPADGSVHHDAGVRADQRLTTGSASTRSTDTS